MTKALSIISKAERGQKIELRPVEKQEAQQTEKVSAKLNMVQDDAGKWALYIKPEGEKGFAVYPEKADVGRFFALAKEGGEKNAAFRQELAQKYYALAAAYPERKTDLFASQRPDVDLSSLRDPLLPRHRGDG